MTRQELKVTLEYAWPRLQIGFPCDTEQVASSVAAACSCVRECTWHIQDKTGDGKVMALCAGAQGWGRKVTVGKKLVDRRRDLSGLSWWTAGIYAVEMDPASFFSCCVMLDC